MYKGASQNAQGRRERAVVVDIAAQSARKEVQSPVHQRESLLRGLENLEQRKAAAKIAGDAALVKELGKKKLQVQAELSAIKSQLSFKSKKRNGIAEFFVTAAKARLSKFQYEVIMKDAQRAFDEQEELIARGDLPPADPFVGVEKI